MGSTLTLDLKNLPQDTSLLKQLVADLVATLESKEERLKELLRQIEQLRRYQFGRRSEKLHPDQAFFEFVSELEKNPSLLEEETPPETENNQPAPETKQGHGRKPLPENLTRLPKLHPLPEEDRQCKKCQQEMVKIGEEVTEQLEYQPASFVVLEHRREKFACKRCEECVRTAPLPAQPIEKGLPGPGLLAHVLVNKYADHLPLNRQAEIFKRAGIEISRKTLCDWVAQGALILEPLYKGMKAELLASSKIHTDDSPVPVLDDSREKTREARLWVYIGGSHEDHVVFAYSPDHRQEWPQAFLNGFKGHLHADGYKGYETLYASKQVIEVLCWAHARRYFYEAKGTDPPRAALALAFIRELYKVEAEAKGLDPQGRHRLRRQRSQPILAKFKEWLEGEKFLVLPKSPMGEAIRYAVLNWEALQHYLDDGTLDIDNNISERELRRICVGRNNWQFFGSDAGGRRAAIIYSLIASSKFHGVNPFAYLTDVLQRVSTHPAKDIRELFPLQWKVSQAANGTGQGV